MTTKEAITLFNYYLQSNHKQRTIESYNLLLGRFEAIYGQRPLDSIAPDEIFHFLEDLTKDMAKSTHMNGWFEYLRHKYRIGMESEHRKLQEEKILLRHQIEEREKAEKEKELLITQLQQALSKVRLLSGFLPICASCRKIRDDKGYWNQIEDYIQDHSEADFSHGMCPECLKKLYPDLVD